VGLSIGVFKRKNKNGVEGYTWYLVEEEKDPNSQENKEGATLIMPS